MILEAKGRATESKIEKSYHSLWNYREVEGLKIPYVFIRNVGSLGPPHGGAVEEVKINVPLDEALFVPPKNKKTISGIK